jgi:hypothetical protein
MEALRSAEEKGVFSNVAGELARDWVAWAKNAGIFCGVYVFSKNVSELKSLFEQFDS